MIYLAVMCSPLYTPNGITIHYTHTQHNTKLSERIKSLVPSRPVIIYYALGTIFTFSFTLLILSSKQICVSAFSHSSLLTSSHFSILDCVIQINFRFSSLIFFPVLGHVKLGWYIVWWIGWWWRWRSSPREWVTYAIISLHAIIITSRDAYLLTFRKINLSSHLSCCPVLPFSSRHPHQTKLNWKWKNIKYNFSLKKKVLKLVGLHKKKLKNRSYDKQL